MLPLREFVYLDAVSVHSLLVSQNATIPIEVVAAISRADEAELSSSIAADVIGVAKAAAGARYQTSNSNSLQSSRKAVIQTLFKELRDTPLEIKLAPTDEPPKPLKETTKLESEPGVEPAHAFSRGNLVEVEVTLSVDPVFKLGALMNEWTAMAGEWPAMFSAPGLLSFLEGSAPVMRILDRFLAGLIPIRAVAVDYVVVEVGGNEYVVHRSALTDVDLTQRPLAIVGVTEHIGYWRDIRRVLFSDARFTILGRVARDGLHSTWTPVKLADLFSEVAPDFVNQINAIRSPSAQEPSPIPPATQNGSLAEALIAYKAILVAESSSWTPANEEAFLTLVAEQSEVTLAAEQREAFDRVHELVASALGVATVDAEADIEARRQARAAANLDLLVAPAISPVTADPSTGPASGGDRLLDVEVIAIYW